MRYKVTVHIGSRIFGHSLPYEFGTYKYYWWARIVAKYHAIILDWKTPTHYWDGDHWEPNEVGIWWVIKKIY